MERMATYAWLQTRRYFYNQFPKRKSLCKYIGCVYILYFGIFLPVGKMRTKKNPDKPG